MGVPHYWVVDGDAHHVEVWTPQAVRPLIERERVEWQPAGVADVFTLDLEELFRLL